MLIEDENPLKGNKGEWSEIYTLIKLLADGKLYQSDYNLNKDLNNVYQIVKAYKDEKDYKLIFERNEKICLYKIDKEEKSELITQFTIEELNILSDSLLNGINQGKGKSFSIIEVDNILKKQFTIGKIKANSNKKADIKLRIYDHRLAVETELGFSIKSLLGKDSTLFNTGYGNNFIYNVSHSLPITIEEFNKITYNTPNGESKITYRINKLEEYGCYFKYERIQSKKLWRNLLAVDGQLPEIMSYALFYRFKYQISDLKSIANLLEEKDPMGLYIPDQDEEMTEIKRKEEEEEARGQKLYENKIKRFLSEAAMGMTAEKPWTGEYDSFGGVIVVKKDGDIVCFHIYDFNLFRNYLLNNTKFEQPSTGEDKENPGNKRTTEGSKKYYFGWLDKEHDDFKFKINLQIRFK